MFPTKPLTAFPVYGCTDRSRHGCAPVYLDHNLSKPWLWAANMKLAPKTFGRHHSAAPETRRVPTSIVPFFAISLLRNSHALCPRDHVRLRLMFWIFKFRLFLCVDSDETRDVSYETVVVTMSKNTLFNYFSRSPAAASNGASKTSGSPSSATPSKRQSSKQNSVTPKRTPKSVNGSAKKDKVSDHSSSKKTTEKRKPKKLGKYRFNSTIEINNYPPLQW